MEESDRINALRKGDTEAQKWLYDRFAPVVFAICKRYLPTPQDAEDVAIGSLFRAMDKVRQYEGSGSFEAWVKRIAVRECLMFLRKRRPPHVDPGELPEQEDPVMRADEHLQLEELLGLIRQLPEGYRTVFQLYEVEGYKHREIAELLGISIHTSKSQLIMAKKRLQALIDKRSI